MEPVHKPDLSTKCQNKTSLEPTSADASSRVMVLLSQSKIRQQLECQVRYFLSWKLLNFHGETGAPGGKPDGTLSTSLEERGGNSDFPMDVGNIRGIRNTLAFKATVALVLGWLKAHNLTHAAGVLCPEAAMRETEVMSQEECINILRLPPSLLDGLPSSATDLYSSLLDRLVAFAANSARLASSSGFKRSLSKWGSETNVSRRKNDGIGVASDAKLCKQEVASPSLMVGIQDFREKNPATVSCETKALSKQTCASPSSAKRRCCSASRHPTFVSNQPTRHSKRDSPLNLHFGSEEEATAQIQVLSARLRRLELHDSSERLFSTRHEEKQILNQRLAAIEADHEAKISQLQRAVNESAEIRGSQRLASRRVLQDTVQEAEMRLQRILRLQADTEIALLRQREESVRRNICAPERQDRQIYNLPLKEVHTDGFVSAETYSRLNEENASLRVMLLSANKRLENMNEQVKRLKIEIDQKPQAESIHGQTTHNHAEARVSKHEGRAGISPETASVEEKHIPWALEKEYQSRVARLTEELQRTTEQIKIKDAEFKILVGELESARHKGAQERRRARRLQKLYEAARTVRAQQKQLVSSLSLSLDCLDLAVESNVDVDKCDVFGEGEKKNVLLKSDGGSSVTEWAQSTVASERFKPPLDKHLAAEPPERHCCSTEKGSGASSNKCQVVEKINKAKCRTRQSSQNPRSPSKSPSCIGNRAKLFSAEMQKSCSVFLKSPAPGSPVGFRKGNDTGGVPGNSRETREETRCLKPTNPTEYSQNVHKKFNSLYTNSAYLAAGEESSRGSRKACISPELSHCISTSSNVPCRAVLTPRDSVSRASPIEQALQSQQSTTRFENEPNCDSADQSVTHGSLSAPLLSSLPFGVQCEDSDKSKTEDSSQPASRRYVSSSSSCKNSDHRERGHRLPSPSKFLSSSSVPSATKPGDDFSKRCTGEHHGVLSVALSEGAAPEDITVPVESKGLSATGAKVDIGEASMQQTPVKFDLTPNTKQSDKAFVSIAPLAPPWREGQSSDFTCHTEKSDAATELALQLAPHGASSPPASSASPETLNSQIDKVQGLPSGLPRLENEALVCPLEQSPWAEASIASSLPESPKRLSNFPSLSCPVATATESFRAPSLAAFEGDARWPSSPKKHLLASEGELSSSPSDNDWLACISPSPKTANPNFT